MRLISVKDTKIKFREFMEKATRPYGSNELLKIYIDCVIGISFPRFTKVEMYFNGPVELNPIELTPDSTVAKISDLKVKEIFQRKEFSEKLIQSNTREFDPQVVVRIGDVDSYIAMKNGNSEEPPIKTRHHPFLIASFAKVEEKELLKFFPHQEQEEFNKANDRNLHKTIDNLQTKYTGAKYVIRAYHRRLESELEETISVNLMGEKSEQERQMHIKDKLNKYEKRGFSVSSFNDTIEEALKINQFTIE